MGSLPAKAEKEVTRANKIKKRNFFMVMYKKGFSKNGSVAISNVIFILFTTESNVGFRNVRFIKCIIL
jgi:hypothetical protein